MGGVLKLVGLITALAGAYFVLTALWMETVVNPDGQGYVSNMQLMQMQIVRVLVGAVLALGGILSLIAGIIVDHIREQTDRVLKGDAPTTEPEIYS